MTPTTNPTSTTKRDDMIVHEQEPYNAEPPPSALARHALTPIDTFYARNHGPIPRIDADEWRLHVDGMVDRPVVLSLSDLRERFARREVVATLQCAGNGRAGLMAVHDIPGQHPWGPGATSTASWAGVSLADVLTEVGLQAGVTDVELVGPDVAEEADPPQPYGGSIAVTKAMAEETILAWEMNGEPLPADHGGPVRVVVPGHIGARSVKWIDRVTARNRPSDNFFQATAYRLLPADHDTDHARVGDGFALSSVALNSAILCPDDGAELSGGPTEVAGYAFAGGDRHVSRVDVSADGGTTWAQAELDGQDGPWTWQLWHATVDLPDGATSTITARAWDTSAALQPRDPADLWNPKGYINNAWPTVTVTTALAAGEPGGDPTTSGATHS